MADAPHPITSPPAVPGQPYDATEDGTCVGWQSVNSNSGPANMQGAASGDFPDDGAGIWKQT